jgi:hypothetical protein
MVKYTLDELLLRKFEGWDMREYVFLSVIGELSLLTNFDQLQRRDNYSGARGMSVCVVCAPSNATAGYLEVDKLVVAGAENIALWVLGKPYVKEISFNGRRSNLEGNVTLSDGWNQVVQELTRAAA